MRFSKIQALDFLSLCFMMACSSQKQVTENRELSSDTSKRSIASADEVFKNGQRVVVNGLKISDKYIFYSTDAEHTNSAAPALEYSYSEWWPEGKLNRLARRMSVGAILNLKGTITMENDKYFWFDPDGYNEIVFPLYVPISKVLLSSCEKKQKQLLIGMANFYSANVHFSSVKACEAALRQASAFQEDAITLVIPDSEGIRDIWFDAKLSGQ